MNTRVLVFSCPEYQLVSEGPAPTETRNVIMRVMDTLILRCSLEASGDYVTEWSKDDQQLSHGSKYSIKQYQPTVLEIHNTGELLTSIFSSFTAHAKSQIMKYQTNALYQGLWCPASIDASLHFRSK